jgi:hypothetical protein
MEMMGEAVADWEPRHSNGQHQQQQEPWTPGWMMTRPHGSALCVVVVVVLVVVWTV